MSTMKSSWKNRRVLVTGPTGIVGSWLIKELLSLGAYVVGLIKDADHQSELYRSGDIRRISVVNGSLEEFRLLEKTTGQHEVDTVFHLGAQTIVDTARRFPLQTFETNIRGTYNLLEACRVHIESVQCVVIASSDKAYGEQTGLPYTEEMPLKGQQPYDVSKTCADFIAQTYYHAYGLPVVITRCGNIYGGGDLNWSRIVPGTIRSLALNEVPIIRSDGSYIRDYIYVKDVVSAYIRIGECFLDPRVPGSAFNIGTDTPLTVLELVKIIQRLMNSAHLEPRILNCDSGEIRAQYLSSSRARKVLGWKPLFDLERGLTETIEWYTAFMEG